MCLFVSTEETLAAMHETEREAALRRIPDLPCEFTPVCEAVLALRATEDPDALQESVTEYEILKADLSEWDLRELELCPADVDAVLA